MATRYSAHFFSSVLISTRLALLILAFGTLHTSFSALSVLAFFSAPFVLHTSIQLQSFARPYSHAAFPVFPAKSFSPTPVLCQLQSSFPAILARCFSSPPSKKFLRPYSHAAFPVLPAKSFSHSSRTLSGHTRTLLLQSSQQKVSPAILARCFSSPPSKKFLALISHAAFPVLPAKSFSHYPRRVAKCVI